MATQVVGGVTVATLTFCGPNSTAGSASLNDGNWTLTVHAAAVTNGGITDGSDFTQTNIKRLYGDIDGNGVVNAFDFAQFRLSLRIVFHRSGLCAVLRLRRQRGDQRLRLRPVPPPLRRQHLTVAGRPRGGRKGIDTTKLFEESFAMNRLFLSSAAAALVLAAGAGPAPAQIVYEFFNNPIGSGGTQQTVFSMPADSTLPIYVYIHDTSTNAGNPSGGATFASDGGLSGAAVRVSYSNSALASVVLAGPPNNPTNPSARRAAVGVRHRQRLEHDQRRAQRLDQRDRHQRHLRRRQRPDLLGDVHFHVGGGDGHGDPDGGRPEPDGQRRRAQLQQLQQLRHACCKTARRR